MISAADILKCTGPAASRISHTTVFYIAACDAFFLERITQMTGIRKFILGPPVTAVNKKDDWMRPFACRQAHINELICVRPVRNAQVGIEWLLTEDGFALHRDQYTTPRIFLSSTQRPDHSRKMPSKPLCR